MRRKTFLPRFLGGSLLFGLAWFGQAYLVPAQGEEPAWQGFGQQITDGGVAKDAKGGAKEATDMIILVLPKDSTRQIEMSTRELITDIRSENPKVVKIQALLDNPRAALVTGIAPGTTKVYLTDAKKNTEWLDIRVPLDEEADREAKRRELLDQIQKVVPTAKVDVLPTGNGTVIVSGNVPLAESVQTVMELTKGTFGLTANIVNNMRIGGVQQVQLEVTIARVNRSRLRQIGFSWLNTGQHHFLASSLAGSSFAQTSTLPSILAPAAALSSAPNVVFGVFNDKAGLFGYLNALTTEGLNKIISAPTVTTLSGRPGYIVDGGETPILTTGGTGAPSVSYKTFGTVVNFLPIVLGNGKIHLEVRPEISNINAGAGIQLSSSVGTTSVPGFDVRSVQVAVQMEDGQTLAIGGLIQNTINASNAKVPILGDIPFLAFAFTNKSYTENEEELLILVTPHLVDPMACNQIPKHLPGRETRTPDDFELFLEGILEAPRGQRNLTHPYTAAYLNSPTASVFPCGDLSGTHDGFGAKACGTAGCTTGTCGTAGVSATSSVSTGLGTSTTGLAIPGNFQKVEQALPENREIRPATDAGAEMPPVPNQIPATLPPLSSSGASTEMERPRATFGPAIMTDPSKQ
jgi:pilus assembly protein CpaC